MAGQDEAEAATPPPETWSSRVEARLRTLASRPMLVLGGISVTSLVLRCFRLDKPNGLAGDEIYYVNAARDIIGQHSPATTLRYLGAGIDSNPAHPPLAKLLMAISMKVVGDQPIAWRIPSILFGTAAILLIYWLVRAAGGHPPLALTASAIMAADNLFLVHGRIATLDIGVLAFMLLAVALHLRGRWVYAGIATGVAMCTKLVGADVVLVILLIEATRFALRWRHRHDPESRVATRAQAVGVGGMIAVTAVSYLAILGTLDHFVGREKNPVTHTREMLTSLSRPNTHSTTTGSIAPESGPVQWFLDQEPIVYWQQPPFSDHDLDFRGVMSPVVIFAALPALALAGYGLWREHDGVSLLVLAWLAGTLGPFVYGTLIHRTSYIYYMVIVMPAIYIAIARSFFSRPRLPDTLRVVLVLGVAYNLVALYPIRSWTGG